MSAEFTAIIEAAEEGGFVAFSPEVPGANGQGESIDEAKKSLSEAIRLILDDLRDDAFRRLSDKAIRDTVKVA